MKKAIDYIVSIIIKIRKKRTLTSLLYLISFFLIRDIFSQLSAVEKIINVLSRSTMALDLPIASWIIKILSYILFPGNSTTSIVLLIMFVVAAILKYAELKSFDNPKFQKRVKEIEVESQEKKDKEIKRHISKFEKSEKRKNTQINLLNTLINKGLIEEEDVYNHIKSNDIYAVYIYANTLPPIDISGVKDYTSNRKYPKFLEQELKFVRMGVRSTLFVTNTKRLPRNLRDTKNLKEYLLKKLDQPLLEEWTDFLKWLKRKRKIELKRLYDSYKNKKHKEMLGLSVTIVRGKINEDNIGFLHKNVLTPKFQDMLNEEVKLGKIIIPREKKVLVKKFVLDSSIELLFFGETKDNLGKLMKLESKLKRALDIKQFTDYKYKSKEDVADIFKEEFSTEVAKRYAHLLILRAERYEKNLKALGVSV